MITVRLVEIGPSPFHKAIHHAVVAEGKPQKGALEMKKGGFHFSKFQASSPLRCQSSELRRRNVHVNVIQSVKSLRVHCYAQMNQTVFSRSSLFEQNAKNKVLTAAEVEHQKKQRAKRHAKRKKPRWKDRVGPAAPEVQPTDDVIDEATLTRCTRCPAHRNRTGRFRPLIGNGEHVCDDCYQREFPATAMLDDADQSELNRRVKRTSDFFRNKIADNVADVAGRTRAADPDASVFGPDDGTDYPSELECRMCLERAVFRRCCSAYYCHSCYYKTGRCPGCRVEAPLTGIAAAALRPDPGKFAVGLSWALSFVVVLVAVACAALAYFNASTAPTTLWGHTCRGWFPVCDLTVCVDYDGGDGENGYGEGGGFLPPAQPYRVCDRASSRNQVVGSACVYDQELYTWSNGQFGYDICVSSPREEDFRPRNVSSVDPLLLYSNNQSGLYVFDDDFELPLREASARWAEVINGNRSSACGVNSRPPERGNHGGFGPVQNENALAFSGVHLRHATTVSLDVKHGGRVEFYIKMGPMSSGDTTSECQTAFSDVTIQYSTISAGGWITFGVLPAWIYRGEEFSFVSQDFPIEAWTNSTRFRFQQESFDVLRDHWAIDDVRIFAHLKPEWRASNEFTDRKAQSNSDIKLSQCCYGTDQCSVFDEKRTLFHDDQCGGIPRFDKSKSSSRLKISELLILFLCLAACWKSLYRLAVWRFSRRALAIQRKPCNDAVPGQPEDAELFPSRSFNTICHLSYQNAVAAVLIFALATTIYFLLESLMVFKCMAHDHDDDLQCGTDLTYILACSLAVLFDVGAIKMLLVDTFHIRRPWKGNPLKVVVDLHPDRSTLHIGSGKIPLSEVLDIRRQSAFFYGFLSCLFLCGGAPMALGSLALQAPLLGFAAILRVILGPGLFVKLYLSIEWVLTLKQEARDELGRSIRRKGLAQQIFFGSVLAPILVMSSLLSRRVDDVSATDNFVLFLVCTVFGGLSGLLLGVANGLPVVPNAKLTGWPTACCTISYYARVECPCLFSCNFCGEMHSRQKLLIVALDEMFALKRMLQGKRNMTSGEG
ncbi:hypothetical protein ACHAWF_010970 [Thalassiosira exigua]